MEYILQTNNLSKVYESKTVLNQVSIHVPKKSIYGLVGKKRSWKNHAYAYYLRINTAKSRQLYIIRKDK